MEKDKRKRSQNGEVEGRRTKSKEGKGDLTADQRSTEAATATATATEEEVEEFFAILRRVREVVRYFGKGKNSDGEGAVTKVSGKKGWSPSFQWEDFEDVHQGKQQDGVGVVSDDKGNKIKGRAEKRDGEAAVVVVVEENPPVMVPRILDLNAEPESLAEMN